MNAGTRKDRGIIETFGVKRHQNIEEDASGPLIYSASSFPNLSPRFPFLDKKLRRDEQTSIPRSQPQPPAWVFFEGTQAAALWFLASYTLPHILAPKSWLVLGIHLA